MRRLRNLYARETHTFLFIVLAYVRHVAGPCIYETFNSELGQNTKKDHPMKIFILMKAVPASGSALYDRPFRHGGAYLHYRSIK